jgi:hypothetical protein
MSRGSGERFFRRYRGLLLLVPPDHGLRPWLSPYAAPRLKAVGKMLAAPWLKAVGETFSALRLSWCSTQFK